MFSSFAFATLASLIAAAQAAQFNVTVGGGPLTFNPSNVNANPGDIVIFTFKQANHTATQSTLANPCQMAPGGFDSGFMPVSASNTDGPFPAAQFTVQNTNPVWVYCRQANHCQQGMVFAINPGDKFAAFQAAAMSGGSASAPPSTSTAPPPSGTSSAGSSAPTTGTGVDHKVVVGGSSLVYNPSNISANVGDTVTFQFMQKNHTATQSTFADPCRALTLTSTSGQIGIDSGFMPVAADATTFPTYTFTVNDTTPIWVYCKQTGHCGQGMVFSVNAVESGPNNYAAFKANAMRLNGTSTSASSAPSQTGTGKSGGAAPGLGQSAGALAVMLSAVFGMML
ncbi:hypothetical protein BJ138DRAFT_1064855 [Hygrophoropsis aurantiaca]|uniref:Uncharacterized protein n=1 Tax=Hygrophoropsis aurantiaca TaxID=72124 RepID=A0ACB8ABK6_9AGAM|nr:hypothetical protein BJ138DRAFT_1064855 [Hygrophoropsis aurantiaca]